LPAELILLIAQQLIAPALAISQTEQPADSLLNLASTCKTIHSLLSILTQHQSRFVITNDNHELNSTIITAGLKKIIDDSILTIIKRSPNLKDLRIWRDFLIGYPNVNHCLTVLQWSTLHDLSLKGLYGNSFISLQASLRNISNKAIQINLKSLDLDEPYLTQGLLLLLEAFVSPILINLQVVLETPLKRWWPYKLLKDCLDCEAGSSTKKILVYDPFSAQPPTLSAQPSSSATNPSCSSPPNSSSSALQSSSSTFKSSSLRTSSCPRI
ncbi:hypothetical protein MJO28_008302, partial [Puccinia striiformis f. sp. tritici]